MGKTETVGGVVRGSESASAVAEAPVTNRIGGYVPLWEGASANAFPHLPWDKRSYGFSLTEGSIMVMQEDWLVSYDRDGNGTSKSVSGTLIVPKDSLQITYNEVVTLFENCRKQDAPMRRVFARHFGHRLSGDHKMLLAAAPDVYLQPLPKSGVEAKVDGVDVEAFWKSVDAK